MARVGGRAHRLTVVKFVQFLVLVIFGDFATADTLGLFIPQEVASKMTIVVRFVLLARHKFRLLKLHHKLGRKETKNRNVPFRQI